MRKAFLALLVTVSAYAETGVRPNPHIPVPPDSGAPSRPWVASQFATLQEAVADVEGRGEDAFPYPTGAADYPWLSVYRHVWNQPDQRERVFDVFPIPPQICSGVALSGARIVIAPDGTMLLIVRHVTPQP